jgi:hypothetical protein
MKTLAAVLCASFLLTFATSATARYLSEQQARQKAAAFLKGGLYGRTAKIAGSRIQKAQLIKAGTSKCGHPMTRPIWRFHVVVPATAGIEIEGGIDGYLEIDAQSGEEVCSPLPGFE